MKKVTGQVSPPPHMAEAFKKLLDLGEGRLANMDAAGIDMQVLSLSASGLDKSRPRPLRTFALVQLNAMTPLPRLVSAHPDRFPGFAHLALQEPDGAAAELERCVVPRLGF